MKRRILFIGILLLAVVTGHAQVRTDYRQLHPERVESKNYYLTMLLGELPEVDNLLSHDHTLADMARQKLQTLHAASTSTERVEAMKFTSQEIEQVGTVLAKLYKKGNVLGKLLAQHIIPSGLYAQHKEQGGALLKSIWQQDAEGMNHAIDIYAAARQPNYPMIDSISFDINSPRFVNEILPACQQNVELASSIHLAFYSVPLNAAKMLLDVNERNQAADYEPLGETVNKAAYDKVATTRWSDYPYTAVLVLGVGPEDKETALSAEGKLRTAHAAMMYEQGQVPFIILSGGRVHPYHTKFCEAEEMKRYLLEHWNIPESAIIMEPHARHTTTNFRNAARIMLRLGFPTDRKAVGEGSKSHIDSVVNGLAARCVRELGYEPFVLGERVSERLVEFTPCAESLQINPGEPMDP